MEHAQYIKMFFFVVHSCTCSLSLYEGSVEVLMALVVFTVLGRWTTSVDYRTMIK